MIMTIMSRVSEPKEKLMLVPRSVTVVVLAASSVELEGHMLTRLYAPNDNMSTEYKDAKITVKKYEMFLAWDAPPDACPVPAGGEPDSFFGLLSFDVTFDKAFHLLSRK
jgi:hypothetical protein